MFHNVSFFNTTTEAVDAGYRECNICLPLHPLNQNMQSLVDIVTKNSEVTITDVDLIRMKYNPRSVRKWFIDTYAMSFHKFQSSTRMHYAQSKIIQGENIVQSAYTVGYNSVSGFGYMFKKLTKKSPKDAKSSDLLVYSIILTPLGDMLAVATNKGICTLAFIDNTPVEAHLKELSVFIGCTPLTGENIYIQQLQEELAAYFAKKRIVFQTPLDLYGTAFQKKVWQTLATIPYGTTISYKEESERMDMPSAFRAVANANGKNRIAIVLPCHRVIGSNGKLHGYSSGVWRKQWLLNHELQVK